MSFFRSEAIGQLTRWAESALYAGLTFGAVSWLWSPPMSNARIFVVLIIAAAGFWLTRAALLSAMAGGPLAAPGVVSIDERRIAYFGPTDGGVVSINGLSVISVDGRGGWQLWPEEGEPPVAIPASAEGADGLIDAFSALPGFQPAVAVAALRGGKVTTIWRRTSRGSAHDLAPPERPV
ncbi:MAG: hypothetical protein ACPGVA_10840 [Pikeienuella sp.]